MHEYLAKQEIREVGNLEKLMHAKYFQLTEVGLTL